MNSPFALNFSLNLPDSVRIFKYILQVCEHLSFHKGKVTTAEKLKWEKCLKSI